MNKKLKMLKKSKRAKGRKSGRKNEQVREDKEELTLLVNHSGASVNETKAIEDEECIEKESAAAENTVDQEEAACSADDADSNCADDESSINDEEDEQIVSIEDEHAGSRPIEERMDRESEKCKSPSKCLEGNFLRRRLKMNQAAKHHDEERLISPEANSDADELPCVTGEPIGEERSNYHQNLNDCKANEDLNLENEEQNLKDEETNLKKEKPNLENKKPNLREANSETSKPQVGISTNNLNFVLKGKLCSTRGVNTKLFNPKEMFEIYNTNTESEDSEQDSDNVEPEDLTEIKDLLRVWEKKKTAETCGPSRIQLISQCLRVLFIGFMVYTINSYLKEN